MARTLVSSAARAVRWLALPATLVVLLPPTAAPAADTKALVGRHEEVIYGHKAGMALTLDFLQPRKPNGVGVLFVMSGGWVSRRDPLAGKQRPGCLRERLKGEDFDEQSGDNTADGGVAEHGNPPAGGRLIRAEALRQS